MPGQVCLGFFALASFALTACTPGAEGDAQPFEATLPSQTARAYLPDRVMVRTAGDESLDRLADDHWARVARRPGASGLGLLEVDPAVPIEAWLHDLSRDPRVAEAYAVGATGGTTDVLGMWGGQWGGSGSATDRWYLDTIAAPSSSPAGFWTVAVLDTGVAYEWYAPWGQDYRLARSLDNHLFPAPYDFVNDDSHANDDHQHGTMMATLIAGDRDNSWSIDGVARFERVMPVKVLDADCTGDEVALIDGITHAVNNGADVINMSLAFGSGYVPSPPLKQALQDAADAGVVMVAAAGNNGAHAVTWPAASPLVIAVGAGTINGQTGKMKPASYSNHHLAVDIVAPGGDLTQDDNGDGTLDGVTAEGVDPHDPLTVGLWMTAGTSPAAAITSGAAVHMLSRGAAPEQVALALQAGADKSGYFNHPLTDGYGGGGLDIGGSNIALYYGHVPPAPVVYGGVMPWIRDDGANLRPAAELMVVDGQGTPYADARVLATIWGETSEVVECRTGSDGTCIALGAQVPDDVTPHSWAVSLDAMVVENGYGWPLGVVRPHSAIFASDAVEILVAAMEGDPATADGVLAFYWDGTPEPDLGDIAEGYTVIDTGAGFASSPIGLTFTPSALLGDVTIDDVELDLDGTGLADSPIGIQYAKVVHIDGTGLASSPIGLGAVTLVAIDGTGLADSPIGGTGLASSPIGLGARDVYTRGAPAWTSSQIGLGQDAVLLTSGQSPTASLTGTALGGVLGDGGWTVSGYPGATAMVGSGTVDDVNASTDGTGFASSPVGP